MRNYNQLIKKAKLYFLHNQFELAQKLIIDILKEFELKSTQTSNLQLLLGEINVKLNNFKKANEYYFKYLKNNKKNPQICNQIANNYLKLKEYNKSEQYYLKTISLYKNYETDIVNIEVLYDNLG